MAIEEIIDNLINCVFEERLEQVYIELFEDWEDEDLLEETKELRLAFMNDSKLSELKIVKRPQHGTYQIYNLNTNKSLDLINTRASDTDILSDKFFDVFENMKKTAPYLSLTKFFKKIIRDVELSPFMGVLRKEAKVQGYEGAWDKLVQHLIQHKELCNRKSRDKLIAYFTFVDDPYGEREKEKINKFQTMTATFNSLMQDLMVKQDDLEARQEAEGYIAVKFLRIELENHWNDASKNPNTFKEACEKSINKYKAALNESRGYEMKQWFADFGCWLLKVLTCGAVNINHKITTDSMQIALNITKCLEGIEQCEHTFFKRAIKSTTPDLTTPVEELTLNTL